MYSTKAEIAYGLKLESRAICNLNEKISHFFKNKEKVWILQKEWYEFYNNNYENIGRLLSEDK